jgi:hypothetical protein
MDALEELIKERIRERYDELMREEIERMFSNLVGIEALVGPLNDSEGD